MCAYSHDAALCNYSFLVRLYVPFKSPILYVVEVSLCVVAYASAGVATSAQAMA